MNKQERYEAFVLPEGAKKCVPRPGGLGAEGRPRGRPGAAAVRAPCGPGCSRSSARRTPSSAGRPYPLGAAANGGSRNRPGAERTQPPFPDPDPDPDPAAGPDPAPVHGPGT